jgi:hypothetical protein
MYLVAYLIACHDMSEEEAREIVAPLMLQSRGGGENTLDRMNRFKPVIQSLIDDPNIFWPSAFVRQFDVVGDFIVSLLKI